MSNSVEITPLSSSDPYARQEQTFPNLSDEQIERAKTFGTLHDVSQNTVLFERGDRNVDFIIVLKGCIEIYEHKRDGLQIIHIHHKKQFTGEIDLFNNRQILVGGRMGQDGQVIRINRENFRKLITAEPDIGEIVMRAFILRRVGLISHGQAAVTLLRDEDDADSVRIERFLRRNGYPLEVLDCNKDDCQKLMKSSNILPADLPAVVIHLGDTVLKKPSNYELADKLGLTEKIDFELLYDVAIIGGGPAGLSAAVYAASEGLSVILLEEEAPGGQASTSSKIENYLGFPTGLSGQALAGRAQIQAMKFGAHIVLPYTVKSVAKQGDNFYLTLCSRKKIKAKSIVVASGARYRKLDLDNRDDFDNAGIYYAATALESEICKKEEAIVVGGGNSAGQAAVFLSKAASHVHMLVRGKSLAASMSDYLIERINASDKITLHTETEISSLIGEKRLEQVTWRDRATGKISSHDIRHVFLMIGAVPHTQWIKDCVVLDDRGFIITGVEVVGHKKWPLERAPMMLESTQPGIFAAGDVRSGSIKRVASGVGEGSMSISHVHQYLADIALPAKNKKTA